MDGGLLQSEQSASLVHALDQIDMACIRVDAELNIVFENRYAASLFEPDLGSCEGTSFLTCVPKPLQAEFKSKAEPLLSGLNCGVCDFNGIQYVLKAGDGTLFPCEITMVATEHPDNPGLTIFIRDLRELLSIQDDLISKTSSLELLNRVLEASNKSDYFEDVLNVALTEICRFSGWQMGFAFLPAVEKGDFRLSTVRYHDDCRAGSVDLDFNGLDQKFNLVELITGVSNPYWFNDVNLTDLFLPNEPDQTENLGAVLAMAIEDGNDCPIAILVFFSDDDIHPSDDFLRIVSNIRIELRRFLVRRRDQMQLLNAKLKAEAAVRTKSAFLANMNHELRTPLNAIIGFSEFMACEIEDPITENQKEKLNHVVKAARHLDDIINNVLELAHFENKSAKIEIEKFYPEPIITDLIALVQPLADKKNILTTTDRSLNDVPPLKANIRGMTQVMLNLISNAIKYNKDQGRVRISAAPVPNGRYRISVSDTGIGISPDDYENVFEPFNRLSQENSEVEGTGIGLNIAKNIAEQMDGQIDFESKPGVGTTFWIELPVYGETNDRDTEFQVAGLSAIESENSDQPQ